MTASVHVGRVGGLAVALGIGVAAGGGGVAWASPADTSDVRARAESSASAASSAGSTTPRPRGGGMDRRPATGVAGRGPVEQLSVPVVERPAARVSRIPAAAAPIAATSAPDRPDRTLRAAVTAAAETAPPSLGDIIQYTLFHKSATANPAQNPGQSLNGRVTGSLNASTDNGATMTYTLAQDAANGTVDLRQDGTYTYTPSVAFAAVGGIDTFGVSIDNSNPASRLTGIGGAIQGILSSLAQLIGLRQPDTVTVAVPVRIVGNSGPVFTAPTVGAPNALTGLVTGQINATDPEGGTLAYSGSGSTAKGVVSIDPITGAFSYTPNPSSRGIGSGVDTFVTTVTDGYGSAASLAVEVPVAAWVATNSMVRYAFNYTGGAEYWSPDAVKALQFAADRIASYLVVTQPVTLTFDITGLASADSTTLASAGSNLAGFGSGYFYTVVQNKILRGIDFNGDAADGVIDVNFAKSWSYGDSVGFSEYDLASVLMHEMMHAYGFTSAVDEPGNNTRTGWPLFASAIVDQYGASLIDPSYRFNTALNANLTGGNGGLYFAGANAVDAYGYLVPLYTPEEWDSGSSVAHLDEESFFGDDAQLMNPGISNGQSTRVLSPIEQGILRDIGYTVQDPMWASVFLVGFLFARRKSRQ